MGNGDVLFRGGGVIQLRTVEDMGEGGVKKQGKSDDVLYGKKGKKHIYFYFIKQKTQFNMK